jgi:endonuclease/exonuclease/phosphatase family metal-dependent hydrolase
MTLLCRLPIVEQEVIDLPRLRADRTDRKAIAVEIEVDGCHLRVVGTHLAHLEVGSVFQMRALHRRLGSSEIPTVLCGDMNSWGLPLLTMFPGWRRAVKGATWPAWRPHSQIDHIIYRGPLEVARSEVLTDFGSDHRPVRATFRLGSAKTHPS